MWPLYSSAARRLPIAAAPGRPYRLLDSAGGGKRRFVLQRLLLLELVEKGAALTQRLRM